MFSFWHFKENYHQVASLVSKIPDILAKTNKQKGSYCILILHNFICALESSEFPTSLKHTDGTPIFKKDNKFVRLTIDHKYFSQIKQNLSVISEK